MKRGLAADTSDSVSTGTVVPTDRPHKSAAKQQEAVATNTWIVPHTCKKLTRARRKSSYASVCVDEWCLLNYVGCCHRRRIPIMQPAQCAD